ncbi:hypothetical protein [Desertimonas flava]|uniref:hypothetical protein n=1 Tax=Desertimonas flava TaxID=2064846 RepID=UPI000E3462E8|nr:hypothetical protein [Desertimonas flava]
MADQTLPPHWVLRILGTSGEVTPLPQWSNLIVTENITGTSKVTFSMPGDSIEATKIVELQTDVVAYRNRVRKARRRIVTADDDLDDTYKLAVTAVDYRQLLRSRQLHNNITFTGMSQGVIVSTLIAWTQSYDSGDLGILMASNGDGGITRDRTYETGDLIGERIDQLSEVINGFDWHIDNNLGLWIWNPRREQLTTKVLAYRANVARLRRRSTASEFRNVVTFYGDPDHTVPVTVDALPDPRGRWEWEGSSNSVKLQETVQEHAEGELERRSNPRSWFEATIAPGKWDELLLELGDIVTLQVMRGRLNFGGPCRVEQIQYKVDVDGGEVVTLGLRAEPGAG